ncbi:MAG: deoxyribonuclease V [bacterium]
MKVHSFHPWDVSPAEAIAIQRRLCEKIIISDDFDAGGVRTIAGADVSYAKGDDCFYATVVVLSYPSLEIIEIKHGVGKPTFPYIPGLLVFREGPVIIKVFEELEESPDVIIFDGHGVSHPRGIGIATHMGILLSTPSIGCAKSKLVGKYEGLGTECGVSAPLVNNGKTVGTVLRSREGVEPVFVSVGHKIQLSTAVEIVQNCLRGYRLPEPTRLAHIYSNKLRTGEIEIASKKSLTRVAENLTLDI